MLHALGGAVLAMVVGLSVLLCSATARADNRSGVVNPGNAKHLGNPSTTPAEPKSKGKLTPDEPAAPDEPTNGDDTVKPDDTAPAKPAKA